MQAMNSTTIIQSDSIFGLTELIQDVVATYWTSFYCICILWKYKIKFEVPKDINVVTIRYDPAAYIHILRQTVDAGCQAYIVQDDILTEFLNTFRQVHDSALQRFPRKQMIIFMEKSFDVAAKLPIFQHETFDDIPHNLIISGGRDIAGKQTSVSTNYDLFTLRYTSPGNSSDPVLLDSYSLDDKGWHFDRQANLFPDKFLNLEKKVIKYATFNYKPYTMWKDVKSLDDSNSYYLVNDELKYSRIDGTENILFLEFCIKYNCSLELSLDEAGEWGEIYDNRTGNGVLGAIVERRADVGAGALYSWSHEFEYLAFSKQITRTGITCIVPKPRLLADWRKPILPFSLKLWLGVIGSLLIGIFGLRLIYKLNLRLNGDGTVLNESESFLNTALNVAKLYVLQSITLRNPSAHEMFIVIGILIISQLLGSIYSGGLASVMTIQQYEKPIDTVEELATSGMKWGATHDAWIFSILLTTQPILLKLLANFETLSKSELMSKSRDKNFGFSIEHLPYGHFAIGEYIEEEAAKSYEIMIEDIYWESCIAMSTKTWPLLPQLDDLILLIAQSGIQKIWELDIVRKHSNNKLQIMIANSRQLNVNYEPITLTIKHLVGAFILLGMGLIFATCIFIIEIQRHCCPPSIDV